VAEFAKARLHVVFNIATKNSEIISVIKRVHAPRIRNGALESILLFCLTNEVFRQGAEFRAPSQLEIDGSYHCPVGIEIG
jgi:hypothetical protein